jgi:hypothetical protein
MGTCTCRLLCSIIKRPRLARALFAACDSCLSGGVHGAGESLRVCRLQGLDFCLQCARKVLQGFLLDAQADKLSRNLYTSARNTVRWGSCYPRDWLFCVM